jgi:anti-sigma B factor antagonist
VGAGPERPPGLGFASHLRDGYTIAELSGDLDIVCVPVLRERLLGVLRPDANRLVVDLSRVNFCDASGLTVLVGTGRRAELLGGVLRLAAPSPSVETVLHTLGLHRKLDVFSTVRAATTSPESSRRSLHRVTGEAVAEVADPTLGRAAVSSGRRPPPCWPRSTPGTRRTPTAGSLPRSTFWPARTPVSTTPT